MKVLGALAIALLAWLASPLSASAQTWQPLKNQPSFPVGAIALLTDGTVLLHEEQDADPQHWYKLTPDNTGSYVNGTIEPIASLPSGYGPFFFASAVLPDGRYIIEGGEYNFGQADWTNMGAIYDPLKNQWTSVNPPSGWGTIGDAPSVVLSQGAYMQSNCCAIQLAVFDAAKFTWTQLNNTGKADGYGEEGWTLLPSGDVLTIDVSKAFNSEIFSPVTKKWTSAGSTIVRLTNSRTIGPMVLRPDGTVFATGANSNGPGHTAIYSWKTRKWKAGPSFPDHLDCADAPASLEINGQVIVMTSAGIFRTGAVFFEWDGKKLTRIPGPPNAPNDSSFYGHFLVLPTGQLLFSDFSTDLEVVTSKGTYNQAWQPTITSVPATITHGKTYVVKGTQFNGLSQGAAYGDDFQDATNFPLVRITNNATKHVFYARTHNFSTMGVATGSTPVSAGFDVPADIETGASSLEVVANGIPSAAASVTVN